MPNICVSRATDLELLRADGLIARPQRLAGNSRQTGTNMQDILWIAIMVGLVAITFAYARLCDNA